MWHRGQPWHDWSNMGARNQTRVYKVWCQSLRFLVPSTIQQWTWSLTPTNEEWLNKGGVAFETSTNICSRHPGEWKKSARKSHIGWCWLYIQFSGKLNLWRIYRYWLPKASSQKWHGVIASKDNLYFLGCVPKLDGDVGTTPSICQKSLNCTLKTDGLHAM